MSHLINQLGSLDDIRISLKLNNYSLAALEAALKDETSKTQPRMTVISLIESTIKKAKTNLKANG